MAKSSKKKGLKKKSSTETKVSKASALPAFFTNRHLHCWLLMAFSFILYANTLTHQYTQDDAIVIYDNMYTTQGLAGIPGILKYDTFKGFFKVEGKDKLVSGGRYRPFTLLLFAAEWQFFKKKKLNDKGQVMKDDKGQIIYEGRPFIGHLLNIIFYGLTGVILYLLILKLLQPTRDDPYIYFVALLTAFLFIAHPLHTEAVANIKGRDEIFTLLGSLAAAYFSLLAFYKNKPSLNIAVGFLFFIALLSKENAITFLAIVPLMYYFFTKAKPSSIFMQMIPFVTATVVFLVIRGGVLGWSLGAPSMELMNNPFMKIVNNQYVPFSASEKMATITYTLGKYIQLLFFPHPLTHDYYPRHVEMMSWGNWKVLLSLVIYIGLGLYALRGLFKKDPIAFGIIFFLATVSIISNIVFAVGTNMSERFMFMPSVGFSFIMAILAWRLIRLLNKGQSIKKLGQMTMVLGIAGLALVLLSTKTISRNFAWKDNFTLFLTDVEVSYNSAKLQNAVGGELSNQALKPENASKKTEMLHRAQGHLGAALKIHPTYKNTHLLLGNVYNYLGEYENSIQYYQKVLEMDPNDENGFNNLGITYRDAGKFYGEKKGDLAKATQYLLKAYDMRGEEYEILRLLGITYGTQGQHSKALDFFRKAVKSQPTNPGAYFNLGTAYQYAGDIENANINIQKAQELDPQIMEKMKKK